MKIRIKGNSVRLRLTKTEVATLCSTGRVAEQTHFPAGIFTYALLAVNTTDQLQAHIVGNTIEIGISKKLITHWDTNDQVGFEQQLPLDGENSLFVLVEKDFVCMDETIEDQTDNYPNPKMG